MEYTIARSLRAAQRCLEQALISWEDHYTHPVMAELYREFAEVCYDFTLAYLRHARYMGTQNATFSYAYEDLAEEKFEDKIDESDGSETFGCLAKLGRNCDDKGLHLVNGLGASLYIRVH